MLQRSVLLAFLVAAFVPALAVAQELPDPEKYHLRGEYSWWWPSLAVDILKGTDGTLTDADDLGVEDERTWEIRGTLRAGASHKLFGSYTKLDYFGDVIDHPTVRYGSQTFFRGTRLVTSMKGAYWAGQYEWDFLKGERGFLGAVLGARFLDLDIILVAPGEARREQESVRLVRPVIGVSGRGYLGSRLSIAGSVAGLTIGSRGYAIDFEATAQIHLFDRVAIKGGYRAYKIKEDSGETLIEMRNQGAFAGVELSL